MINQTFLSTITHKQCKEGIEESIELKAYLLDSESGLANSLNFKNNEIGLVDFVLNEEHKFQLIELTDLAENVRKCEIDIAESIRIEEIRKGAPLSSSERRKVEKRSWHPIKFDFFKKLLGSKLVIERLYRKNNEIEQDPHFHYVIVCKNGTDAKMLDAIKAKLMGAISEIEVCNTEHLESIVIKKIK